MVLVTNRTEASASKQLTPPGWKLLAGSNALLESALVSPLSTQPGPLGGSKFSITP